MKSIQPAFDELIESIRRTSGEIEGAFERVYEAIGSVIGDEIAERGISEEDSHRDADDEFYGYEDGVEKVARTEAGFHEAGDLLDQFNDLPNLDPTKAIEIVNALRDYSPDI